MAFTPGNHDSGVGSAGPIDTTGYDLLVAVVNAYDGTPLGNITDSEGNTWEPDVPPQTSSGTFTAQMYFCHNPTTSAAHTFATTDLAAGMAVFGVSGSASSPLDDHNSATGSGTSLASGSVSPAEANEIVLAAFGAAGGSSYTAPAGFTLVESIDYTGGSNFGVALAYKIQTTATPVNPTWTWTGSTVATAIVATFKSIATPEGYIPGFDVVRIDDHGFRVPVVTGTVTLENLTTIASPYTRAISADGVVAGGSLTGSPGDIIEVSHATYPETVQFVLAATQDEAYTSTQNAAITYVAENLDTRETPAKVGELFAVDVDNPAVPPIKIASVRPGETVLVPEQLLQSTVERNYQIKLVTQDELSQKTGFDLSTAATETLTVPPATGSGGSLTNGDYGDVTISGFGGGGFIAGPSLDEILGIAGGTSSPIDTTGCDLLIMVVSAYTSGGTLGTKSDSEGNTWNVVTPLTSGADTLQFYWCQNPTTDAAHTFSTSDVASAIAVFGVSGCGASPLDINVGVTTGSGTSLASGSQLPSESNELLISVLGTDTNGTSYNAPSGYTPLATLDPAVGVNEGLGLAFKIQTTATATNATWTWTGSAAAAAYLLSFKTLTGTETLTVPDLALKVPYTDAIYVDTAKTFFLAEEAYTDTGLDDILSTISTTRAKLVIASDLTVSSSQTIPATCKLEIVNNAKITVSSSATLTISNFEDPGNVQCFAGVDASNHVVFANGAVERYNLAWYMGVGSTSDCTYAMADIITSVNNSTGGTIFAPAGRWKVDDITLPDYCILEGVGQGISAATGTVFIPTDSGTAYLFRVYRNFRNIEIRDCGLSIETNTTTHALRIEGTTGYSGFGLDCHNVLFYCDRDGMASSYPLVNTSTDQAYEMIRIAFYNCQWIGANDSKCFYANSINSMFAFWGGSMLVGSGDSYGIDAYNAGINVVGLDPRGINGLNYDNVTSIASLTCSITSGTNTLTTTGAFTQQMVGQRVVNGTAFSTARYIKRILTSTTAELTGNASGSITGQTVTVYKWTTNSAKAGTSIRIGAGSILVCNIQGVADEGFNHSLKVVGGSYTGPPITLTGNTFQGRMTLEASCVIYGRGNRYFSGAWADSVGLGGFIYSDDTYDSRWVDDPTMDISYARPWGADHLGGIVFATNFGYMNGVGEMKIGRHTKLLENTQTALTTPLMDILTTYEATASSRQILQRWGVADANSELFKYGVALSRHVEDPYAGYFLWDFSQSDPYKGMVFNGAIGYHSGNRGTITQTGSRTTGVTCNALHGIITCYTYASTVLEPGEIISFVLTNSYLQYSDYLEVRVVDNATTTNTKAWCSDSGGGVATISIKNDDVSTDENASALKLQFTIFKNGGQYGINH